MNSNSSYDFLTSLVATALADAAVQYTALELRKKITALNDTLTYFGHEPLDKILLENLAKEIEERDGISMGLGAIVDGEDFTPWLDDAKKDINPFYWERYRKHLIRTGLPKDVVLKLDDITDKTLGRMGNPTENVSWDKRGMVVGHVQSGKTANYTGLICKAADAGYRLIIVVAGIHNNLRNQTQKRIDEGFIGRDTGRMKLGKPKKKIGVGLLDDRNVPVSLTTNVDDFKKAAATTNKSQIDSYKVPVVLVIKKNNSTLKNLIAWLRENSAFGDQEMIAQPMLLIDDEADNASINTKYGKEKITKINGQIRELLQLFHRSCYVGYTATPFANIFIDPDQEDELLGEDLFPKDFIIGLDAPTNYFGGTKVFLDGIPDDEGTPKYIRYIDDNEDILPVSHRIDHELDELPKSLIDSLRQFLIARTIRNLRGQREKHASMLVNASRFTRVQGLIRNRIHEVLLAIQNALRVNGSIGENADNDPEIAELKQIWLTEFNRDEFKWKQIREAMYGAIAAAKVIEVNSSSKNDLNYEEVGKDGLTVIAVGGFSLSRGLTLEGLTTTWFLRNTMMYDTLMQMGRWFGYRTGYEDLCRIWMPREAVAWYSFIAEASNELMAELKKMEKAHATPLQFGLAVRSHPSSLLVTARNKIGSGVKTVRIGLSSNFVETPKLSYKPIDLENNEAAARELISGLKNAGWTNDNALSVTGGYLLKSVQVGLISKFIASWANSEHNPNTQVEPIIQYINNRINDELSHWDIHISSLKSGQVNETLGWPIIPIERSIGKKYYEKNYISIGGNKMRVSSRGVERLGIDEEVALSAEKNYRAEHRIPNTPKPNYPGKIYRDVRVRPLLALYLVAIKKPTDQSEYDRLDFPKEPVIAWAISFPRSDRPDEKVEYIINTTKQKELLGFADYDEDEDDDSDEK